MRTVSRGSFFLVILFCLCGNTSAADFWVAENGSDSNGCTSLSGDACSSIQKALSLVKAGDTVNIAAGTYFENSEDSRYTQPCYWLDGTPFASICVNSSGTIDAPITIQAVDGDEGLVTIDGQGQRMGIHLQSSDYIRIKNIRIINTKNSAIASWGQHENRIADQARLSIGVIVDGVEIHNVDEYPGRNIAGINMWGSKDWVVRNSTIDYITVNGALSPSHTSAIMAYGTINALIENNKLSGASTGILWKDHFVADGSGTPIFESEIRNNIISCYVYGIQITAMGQGSDEAGNNYIHHNIIYGYKGYESSAIMANIGHALGFSKGLRIEHNLFDGEEGSGTIGVDSDAYLQWTLTGNIFARNSSAIWAVKEGSTHYTQLDESDYNIFAGSRFDIVMDRYSSPSPQVIYQSLGSWQSARAQDSTSLNMDFPDSHSIATAFNNLFDSSNDKRYVYSSNSPAIGFMPDGSNAGPYQYGNEVIGPLNGVGAVRPKPPIIMN